MQVFTREKTDYIAQQLGAYFARKKQKRMSIRDAKTLIDFVSGPAPMPSGNNTPDLSKPRVSGGGAVRPTEQRVEGIIRKYAEESDWDMIFDDLIRQCAKEPEAIKIIRLAFRDGKRESEICDKLYISPRTYYRYRTTILSRAAVLATAAGILDA